MESSHKPPEESDKETAKSFEELAGLAIARISGGDSELASKVRKSVDKRILTNQPKLNPRERYEALLSHAR